MLKRENSESSSKQIKKPTKRWRKPLKSSSILNTPSPIKKASSGIKARSSSKKGKEPTSSNTVSTKALSNTSAAARKKAQIKVANPKQSSLRVNQSSAYELTGHMYEIVPLKRDNKVFMTFKKRHLALIQESQNTASELAIFQQRFAKHIDSIARHIKTSKNQQRPGYYETVIVESLKALYALMVSDEWKNIKNKSDTLEQLRLKIHQNLSPHYNSKTTYSYSLLASIDRIQKQIRHLDRSMPVKIASTLDDCWDERAFVLSNVEIQTEEARVFSSVLRCFYKKRLSISQKHLTASAKPLSTLSPKSLRVRLTEIFASFDENSLTISEPTPVDIFSTDSLKNPRKLYRFFLLCFITANVRDSDVQDISHKRDILLLKLDATMRAVRKQYDECSTFLKYFSATRYEIVASTTHEVFLKALIETYKANNESPIETLGVDNELSRELNLRTFANTFLRIYQTELVAERISKKIDTGIFWRSRRTLADFYSYCYHMSYHLNVFNDNDKSLLGMTFASLLNKLTKITYERIHPTASPCRHLLVKDYDQSLQGKIINLIVTNFLLQDDELLSPSHFDAHRLDIKTLCDFAVLVIKAKQPFVKPADAQLYHNNKNIEEITDAFNNQEFWYRPDLVKKLCELSMLCQHHIIGRVASPLPTQESLTIILMLNNLFDLAVKEMFVILNDVDEAKSNLYAIIERGLGNEVLDSHEGLLYALCSVYYIYFEHTLQNFVQARRLKIDRPEAAIKVVNEIVNKYCKATSSGYLVEREEDEPSESYIGFSKT